MPKFTVILWFKQESTIEIDLHRNNPSLSEPHHDLTRNWRNSRRRLSVKAIRLYLSLETVETRTTGNWLSITRALLDFPHPIKVKVMFERAAAALFMSQMHYAAVQALQDTGYNIEWGLKHEEAQDNECAMIFLSVCYRLLSCDKSTRQLTAYPLIYSQQADESGKVFFSWYNEASDAIERLTKDAIPEVEKQYFNDFGYEFEDEIESTAQFKNGGEQQTDDSEGDEDEE
jgi:hypothetical protein